MIKKEAFYYAMLVALMITGWFIKGYSGGIVTGFGGAMLFAAIVGKQLAKKAADRMNKQMKDFYINHNQ